MNTLTPTSSSAVAPSVAIIGAGPAGLMAAELLAQAGLTVDVYDAMPSVGRKFLLAGKGGLNLTHAEPLPDFTSRYGDRAAEVGRWLSELGPQALRDWAAGLGISTFVGSSGKVFPAEMKAAPLLRAWLHRLRGQGVRLHMRHRWKGALAQDADQAASPWRLGFTSPSGPREARADAVLLALGGGSWARLGSDGAWQAWLAERGVPVAPLVSANCGFDVTWSDYLRDLHAGAPLKSVRLLFTDRLGRTFDRVGECVLTDGGIEGSLIYAASGWLRDEIAAKGQADMRLDLLPARSEAELVAALAKPRGRRSLTNHLREHAGLHGAKVALLREGLPQADWAAMTADNPRAAALLAARIKALPLRLNAARPLDEAISSAGGVAFSGLDEGLMLRALPGVFCAGEMLDWEAPTGGYLLTACFASGRVAAQGLIDWLKHWATALRLGAQPGFGTMTSLPMTCRSSRACSASRVPDNG